MFGTSIIRRSMIINEPRMIALRWMLCLRKISQVYSRATVPIVMDTKDEDRCIYVFALSQAHFAFSLKLLYVFW